MNRSLTTLLFVFSWGIGAGAFASDTSAKVFRAGACAVDITPPFDRVIRNGGFLEASVAGPFAPRSLQARCLVLDDGAIRVAIAVVDSCMLTREVCDRVKQLTQEATKIPTARMLIASTHTHSAPSVMDYCLGTRADTRYAEFLPPRIAAGLQLAAERLTPARVGWAVAQAPDYTHCRRWIRRPDTVDLDPFGQRTVRAMMHPGYQNPAYIGPAGPVDPDLSLCSVQTVEGRPLAVLANYSMHYFGSGPLSADYFGRIADKLGTLLAPAGQDPPPVAMMSQGTAGDLHWMDYSQPQKSISLDAYSEGLARIAFEAYQRVEYRSVVPLAMAERTLTLARRVPDEQRLAWAQPIAAHLKERRPGNLPEVYAEQALYLHENPTEEIKLQALRIGDLGITAIPNEVFGITGLKLKAQSPLQPTFNMELANGASGYIPPPAQHALGGYTTWPARTAGLEVQAEPKIVAALLELLEQVAGKPRRPLVTANGQYARRILDERPVAYWRMSEFEGPTARDASGHEHHGTYEPGVAFYLEGPEGAAFSGATTNHAVHFAGGRLQTTLAGLPTQYTVELWFWNGLPANLRPVTGHFFTRGAGPARETLAIRGNAEAAAQGKLGLNCGAQTLTGRTVLDVKRWYHAVLVRTEKHIRVYLDQASDPEIDAALDQPAPDSAALMIGGDAEPAMSFEGKLCEVSVYDRPLTPAEIAAHFLAP